MPQIGIAGAFGVGAFALAFAILWVGRHASQGPVDLDQIAPRAYRIQRIWSVTLLVAVCLTLAATLPRLPYPATRLGALGSEDRPTTVRIVAYQFGWEMSRDAIASTGAVRFEVTSRDVNHDFAVYDADDHIVGQVQAMPGYTSSLVIRLERPGSYTIRCLELCGPLHSAMWGRFCVGRCDTSCCQS